MRTVLAAAAALIAIAGVAHAQAPVDLQIVDRDTGRVLCVWRHHGRLFVAGQPGARYSLRVANHTDGRVLVLLSVDGVNIISGETAGYGQQGYVFAPYQSYDVTGWRKSNAEVAAFTFAPLPQSYAARTGRPADVGVIGMAVFKEKVFVPPPEPEPSISREGRDANAPAARLMEPASPPPSSVVVTAQRRAQAAPAAKAQSYAADAIAAERKDEKLGTAHGAREWSVVRDVGFERATTWPQFVRQIEYDTYANLVASGVIHPSPYSGHSPTPFPSNSDGARFVPDPPYDP
jgi:hypothetical protein